MLCKLCYSRGGRCNLTLCERPLLPCAVHAVMQRWQRRWSRWWRPCYSRHLYAMARCSSCRLGRLKPWPQSSMPALKPQRQSCKRCLCAAILRPSRLHLVAVPSPGHKNCVLQEAPELHMCGEFVFFRGSADRCGSVNRGNPKTRLFQRNVYRADF